jgi:hypothetical protein
MSKPLFGGIYHGHRCLFFINKIFLPPPPSRLRDRVEAARAEHQRANNEVTTGSLSANAISVLRANADDVEARRRAQADEYGRAMGAALEARAAAGDESFGLRGSTFYSNVFFFFFFFFFFQKIKITFV